MTEEFNSFGSLKGFEIPVLEFEFLNTFEVYKGWFFIENSEHGFSASLGGRGILAKV